LNKAPDAFRTIGEVAAELDLPQHVLRFWESQFPHVKPLKRAGGRRYYRPEDIDLLRGIRRLLYGDGYTIKGVQRILREQGLHAVQSVGQGRHDTGGEAAEIDEGDETVDADDRPGVETDDDRDDEHDDGDDADGDAADGDDDGYDDAPGTPSKARPRQLGSLRRRPRAGGGVSAAASPTGPAAARSADAAGAEAAPGAVVAGRTVPGRIMPGRIMPGLAMPGVAMPGVAAPALGERDLERLRQALAGLEACRRLLEKAVDGQ